MSKLFVKNFSKFPGARYKELGPYSGEAFRDDVLIPALADSPDLIINLDGVMGYGSSFLEEVFGGLIRKGFDYQTIRDLCDRIESNDDPDLIVEILEYVNDAANTD